MPEDVYEAGAEYYDSAYTAKTDLVDQAFYVDLATRTGGPVLELGCGTGRITLPIAERGIDITGVDSSSSMLQVLHNKLDRSRADKHDNPLIVHGDMRDLSLGREFKLVIIPFRPLQHMYTVDDQLAALTTARDHLADDGLFAFDVFFPNFDKIYDRIGEEYLDLEWTIDDGTNRRVQRYFVKDSVDAFNQNFSGRFIYRTYQGLELLTEQTQHLKMSFYTYPHIQLLISAAKLDIVEQFGSFDRKPLRPDSREMIFILRRSSGT